LKRSIAEDDNAADPSTSIEILRARRDGCQISYVVNHADGISTVVELSNTCARLLARLTLTMMLTLCDG
jgi:hypothetical protein